MADKYEDKSVRGLLTGKTMPIPRTHENCRKIYGVARPGKTASDRRNRGKQA